MGKNVPDENMETQEEDHSDGARWRLELREVGTKTGVWGAMTRCAFGATRTWGSFSVTTYGL